MTGRRAIEQPEPADVAGVVARPPLRISEPGIYDGMAEADYHADPCPVPSLSRSELKVIVDLTPAHAYVMHPRLGGLSDLDAGSDDEVVDFGTAAHSSFLQGRSLIRRLDYRDWKTNAAKDARKLAYADGMIPLLVKSYDRAQRLIDVLERFRAQTGAFTQGRPEQTLCWQDGPIWARARVDWMPDEASASPWDLKTTAGKATLEAWSRVAFSKGADLQDSYYCRGLEMVRGEPPNRMLFCVVEQSPPHAIAVFCMAPSTRDAADDVVLQGMGTWDQCLATGEWPAYPLEPQYVFPPPWVTRAREERRTQPAFGSREHPNAVGYVTSDDFGG